MAEYIHIENLVLFTSKLSGNSFGFLIFQMASQIAW